jgi:60 kDa SS-A/Ro ribonucleoprotein
MANHTLFKSSFGKMIPSADAINEAGGVAYQFEPQHALAQYALTGCLNGTFYAEANEQLTKVLQLSAQVDVAFIAKLAVYARREGYMKDMPALLCAVLSTRDSKVFDWVAREVLDSGKMIRTFVQIMRSGRVGRKSLGSRPKKVVLDWLNRQNDAELFRQSIGSSPSMGDVVKMVHPKPTSTGRTALYAYMIGRTHDASELPPIVQAFEAFKKNPLTAEVPDVPFQFLTALELDSRAWSQIARRASWQTLRMNLNTFARHGVFTDTELTHVIAKRLCNPDEIRRSKVFPYQLLAAFTNAADNVPAVVRDALQEAMEIAVANVPAIEGQIYICPDVSGSMRSAVSGARKGATSKVRCIDVAALVAAAFLRQNRDAEILPFENKVVNKRLNPRDTVMTNAAILASIGGGGTNCSAPLAELNARKAIGTLVVYVSDNQSWINSRAGTATATMAEWASFKARNPQARLVCIDIQPYATTQALDRDDVLNIGGFSDRVFTAIADFASGNFAASHLVELIEAVVP